MAEQRERQLSPHLSVWRWGPAMTVSILHRISGGVLTVAGLAVLTWWLMALAKGSDAYGDFSAIAGTWIGLVVLIGLTWAFFQHIFSGIRHLVTDSGENFEILVGFELTPEQLQFNRDGRRFRIDAGEAQAPGQ